MVYNAIKCTSGPRNCNGSNKQCNTPSHKLELAVLSEEGGGVRGRLTRKSYTLYLNTFDVLATFYVYKLLRAYSKT